jgi:uncharacterized protein (DUF302 family)
MLYQKTSRKTMVEIDQALRESAARHKFGVLAVHDLKQTMKDKGVDFDSEVRVYEVCNPHHAKAVLQEEPAVSTALPCRVSVYQSGDGLTVATILPAEMMKMFGSSEMMVSTALEVDRTIRAMIDETA